MNRPKGPSTSRKSLLRERVRARRAAALRRRPLDPEPDAPPAATPSRCHGETSIECSLGCSPAKGSPLTPSVIEDNVRGPSQSPLLSWNACFSSSPTTQLQQWRLWNPSFATDTPRASPAPSSACSIAHQTNLSHRDGLYENDWDESWAKKEEEGLELPLGSHEWSTMRSPEIRQTGRSSPVNESNHATNKTDPTVPPSASDPKKRWGPRAKAKHERIQRLRSVNRQHPDGIVPPPKMEHKSHAPSPEDADSLFIQSRIRYMLEWTDKKNVPIAVVTPPHKEEERRPSPILSIDTPFFYEDDSLFEHPCLKESSRALRHPNGRSPVNLVSPIEEEHGIRQMHVSADSRDIGRVQEEIALPNTVSDEVDANRLNEESEDARLHASVDSRDIDARKKESGGVGKSVESYVAPSFDEAASDEGRSAISRSGESASHRYRVVPAVGSKLLWDGEFCNRHGKLAHLDAGSSRDFDNEVRDSVDVGQEASRALECRAHSSCRDVEADSMFDDDRLPSTRPAFVDKENATQNESLSYIHEEAARVLECRAQSSFLSMEANSMFDDDRLPSTRPASADGENATPNEALLDINEEAARVRECRAQSSFLSMEANSMFDDDRLPSTGPVSVDEEKATQSKPLLGINEEAARVLECRARSSFLSMEANTMFDDDRLPSTGPAFVDGENATQNEPLFDISKEEEPVLNQSEVGVSMTRLMEDSWSKLLLEGTNPRLPPIHPGRSYVFSKDDSDNNHARMQHQTIKNTSSASITENSPTRSDHSADAAAGANQSKHFVFDPLKDCPDPSGVYDRVKKLDHIQMQKVSNLTRVIREKTDNRSCNSIDSWEVDIIGSKASSAAVSVVGRNDEVKQSDATTRNNICGAQEISKQLEMKLEVLRKSAGVPSDEQSSVNEDDKSNMSSRVSIVSIQPSVETACVWQNADIAMLMEDTMMDFMVIDGEEDTSTYSEIRVDDFSRQQAASGDSGLVSQPSLSQAPLGPMPSLESKGPIDPPASEHQSELQPPFGSRQFAQLKHTLPPAPSREPVFERTLSRHQYFSKRHFPSLLSVDEEEEFSEPNYNNIQEPINAKSFPAEGLRVVTRHKDLGKFLDRIRDNVMIRCAPMNEEDTASSWVFSQENSQYNLESSDVVIDEHSDRVTPLPFNKGLKTQARACKIRKDTTPPRANTTKAKALAAITSTIRSTEGADSISSILESETLHKLTTGGSLLQNDRIETNDVALVEQEDMSGSLHADVAQVGAEIAQKSNSNVKAPQTTELVKISEREKRKSRSLHWNSNNGVNEDEQYSPPKFTPMRSRAIISPRVLSSRMSLPSMLSYQANIQEHFEPRNEVKNELKLSYYHECNREDDASDDEAAENDNTPQYDYDDFINDFSTIAKDAKIVLEENDQPLEFRYIEDQQPPPSPEQQRSCLADTQSGLSSSKESYSTMHKIPSMLSDNQTKLSSPLSPSKSNVSFTNSILDQSHPHNVTAPEVSRTMLEQKLKRDGASGKDCCGSSVATSDLGSIMTRNSDLSKACNIPKMVFHRTHPPSRPSNSSYRSYPSSMDKTHNYSTITPNDARRIKVLPPASHRSNLQPRPAFTIAPNVYTQQLRREDSAAAKIDLNDDVTRSKLLLERRNAHIRIDNHNSKTAFPSLSSSVKSRNSGVGHDVKLQPKHASPIRNETPRNKRDVAEVTAFWKQLESSRNSSVDKPCQKLDSIRRDVKKQANRDDASQQTQASVDAFEIAPRGSGYVVMNKNSLMNDEAFEDPTVCVHDVYESASHHAFEVAPLNTAVVAKLPITSKPQRPNNAPYRLDTGPSSQKNTTAVDLSNDGPKKSVKKPKLIGNRVASSPFLKKPPLPTQTSQTANNRSVTKSVISRANVFSSSWKNSPSKKSPTQLQKNETSWISKTRGKSDTHWIVK